MRIGMLGGSFDPIHAGHLVVAETVREALQLDRLVFMPAFQPPHKLGSPIAPPEARLRMVESAIRSNIHFAVSDIEIRRRGMSYTVETVEELLRQYSPGKLYVVMGTDLLGGLPNWHRLDDLTAMALLIVIRRPGSAATPAPPSVADRVKFLDVPSVDISATMVRDRVASGKSIRYLVPEPVEEIIVRERLYGHGAA